MELKLCANGEWQVWQASEEEIEALQKTDRIYFKMKGEDDDSDKPTTVGDSDHIPTPIRE